MTLFLVALAVVLLLVVYLGSEPAGEPLNQRAYAAVVHCLLREHRGSACYRLPIVREAERGGWIPPDPYRILEGKSYHE